MGHGDRNSIILYKTNLDNCYSIATAPQQGLTTCNIKKVIFNYPATIVFWSDGTKTVVKCNNECWDPEKGLAMAVAKKFFGNKGFYYNIFNKWIPEEESNNDSHLFKSSVDEVANNIKEVFGGKR